MEIAIKSECDSRVFVYSLIKCLYNYGTVAVYTTNPLFSRLIENELEGGFKNVRVMVSVDSDLEGVKQSDEWHPGKYDFMIYDNIGAISYDILIALVTNRISEGYVTDLLYIIDDEKTHILKFGNPAPVSKDKMDKSKSKKGAVEAYDDDEFNKWVVEKTDEDILVEKLADKKSKWCKFPGFDVIELMESRHYMITPDDTVIKEIYRLFGPHLAVDERMFTKGARAKDESSSDITGTDVR